MPKYDIIAETNESTVVAEYHPSFKRETCYQSEADLEKDFIGILEEQGYEYLHIHKEEDLIENLRKKLEDLNSYRFSDDEWKKFFNDAIANSNEGIVEKTRKIQENYIQPIVTDKGLTKNITLIDKKNIHNNSLQVINQYSAGKDKGARYDNRYDVTVLINGLPIVHIELKRRGVRLAEAFNQIERYQRDSFGSGCGLFQYVQIFVISNGTTTKYYSNTTRFNAVKNNSSKSEFKGKTSNSFEFTSFWADAKNKIISDLTDFARTFFAKHTLLNVLTRYCVFTSENMLLVMRPYQITAAERILNKISMSENLKTYGKIEGGGYVWHTTGSGKTLTSFKAARLASELPYIDKVLFVVDRKDLDYQTMKEYDRFEQGSADSNSSTAVLQRQLGNSDSKIIITTIQKLSNFIKKNKTHSAYSKRIVIIFDECHRSQFGEMHAAIIKSFRNYNIFGFTGTPIFTANAASGNNSRFITTDQTFGARLHTYTIVDAIRDKNVLPFKIDYMTTMKNKSIDDEAVEDIDREKAYMAPERIKLITEYILDRFNQKTYRTKPYILNRLENVNEAAEAGRKPVAETRVKKSIKGFNSILAVSSIDMAKRYYDEFQRQMKENPSKKLNVALIYSYAANEEEENSEDPDGMDASSREFLDKAIEDYNRLFDTNYDTSADKFQNYYKNISLRMKNKDIDILIVVNMFLTGFDATTLNTLWVDKNLQQHGLIQAFSRTNRIFNSVKTFGNIVCFRNLSKQVDDAISMFGDKEAGGIVIIRTFLEYYKGFISTDGKKIRGYEEIVKELQEKYPVTNLKDSMLGEEKEKEFIRLFGLFLKTRNILVSFDEFEENKILSERDQQDYLSEYQDLRDKWRQIREREDIADDLVFEIELVKQIEINIDYILMLVKKYHEKNCNDMELAISIRKAVDASPELRSKKELIERFIAKINAIPSDDILEEWKTFIKEEREKAIRALIEEERLKPEETRKFIANSCRIGEIKTSGTGIDSIMPPMSRFGAKGENRVEKKQRITEKLFKLFDELFANTGIPLE